MYLLDTNIYISFYERYYPKKYFPTFWEKFIPILQEEVVIPDIVVEENQHNEWFRKDFLKTYYHKEYLKHSDYAEQWQEVLQYIASCGFYSNKALIGERSWTQDTIADGWLIAIAKAEQLTIVTNELPAVNLSKGQPSKNPKIPDVAREFDVPCINMLTFFERVHLKV